MTAHGKENHYYRKAMEAGANSYLVKPFNSPENKTDLRETIKNVTQKALLKRNHKALPAGNKRKQITENTDHILEKLAAQYTLVVARRHPDRITGSEIDAV